MIYFYQKSKNNKIKLDYWKMIFLIFKLFQLFNKILNIYDVLDIVLVVGNMLKNNIFLLFEVVVILGKIDN